MLFRFRRTAVANILISVFALFSAVRSSVAANMPISSHDVSKEEWIRGFELAPDARMLAFFGNSGLWISDLTKGSTRLATSQRSAVSGYGDAIKWSLNGRRLGFVSDSSAGRGIVVWDRQTNGVHEALDQELYKAPMGRTFFEWVDEKRIVCAALKKGHHRFGTEEVAMQGWAMAREQEEPTASVLESGVIPAPGEDDQVDLLVTDVETGSISHYDAGILRAASLSPDRKHLAFLRQEPLSGPEPPAELYGKFVFTYILTVLELTEAGHLVEDYEYPLHSRFPDRSWIEWSPGGSQIAVSTQSDTGPLQWLVCGTQARGCERLETSRIPGHIESVKWSASGNLLAYVASHEASSPAGESGRGDWWLVFGESPPENLTSGAPQDPGRSLISETGGSSFIFLSGGSIWKLGPDMNRGAQLTTRLAEKIDRVLWPTTNDTRLIEGGVVIVAAKDQDAKEGIFQVDIGTGRVRQMRKPNVDSEFVDHNVPSGTDLFMLDESGELQVWSCKESANQCQEIVKNEKVRKGTSEVREIMYHSLKGENLVGMLHLPPGYKEGIKYPLVTVVYGGDIYGGTLVKKSDLDEPLIAHGYAVLFPSMPLPPDGVASDPCIEMLDGVLPAVEKVIDMGIANPAKLGIMGHSYGGYSTYCILGQTNRFQAAIAMAGPSDLISLYGAFQGTSRYTTPVTWWSGNEYGPMRMGGPPWKDPGRYIRNSPIFYVERMETPVMIVQGDEDSVPIEQGEEMFSALQRENKRAQFVRYWGEGHSIENPQNVKDLWQRIYAWFDTFLVDTSDH